MSVRNRIWWGAPRKFSATLAERKISWLELFYDLVYVIVISRTTARLVQHPTMQGIGEYIYLFSLIFWGWLNGSQYHDLHGSPGIRTRFMTLWQMIAVAALAVALDSPPGRFIFRTTVSIAFLQLFITYLWWSVGIYDRAHRRLNIPYTVCYLISLGLIIGSLFMPAAYTTLIFWVALVFNFLPPLIMAVGLRQQTRSLSLSTSMTERLGLMVIIVFGEAILGVINGMHNLANTTMQQWLCFGLGILVLFGLWWVFFGLIADRECKPGFGTGMVMSLIYIPAIASLGMAGASFPALMSGSGGTVWARPMYGISLSAFLLCIALISSFLKYPSHYLPFKRPIQWVVAGAAAFIALFTWALQNAGLLTFLVASFTVLLVLVSITTAMWVRVEREVGNGSG
jgi:low temperature requirement protein LtrA